MKAKKFSLFTIIYGAAATFIFILFLIRSDVAIDYMKTGLKLCASTVIPSLFPFTVASTLLISSGAGIKLCRPISMFFRPLLGISEGGACAFILGTLCGFPIGAKSLCDMYDRNMITKQELERVLTFCNNPGSAFVISAVGISLFGSVKIGITLYICTVLSSVLVGVLGRFIFCKTNKSAASNVASSQIRIVDGTKLFTDAIRDSALSMLTISAMIAFFSSLSGCIGATLSRFGAGEWSIALFSAFFEMSGGVSAVSDLSTSLKVILCAAALGWSGLSVHFQVMSLCSGRGINFFPYFVAKSLQSLFSGLLAALFFKIVPISEYVYLNQSNPLFQKEFNTNFVFLWCVISVALCISGAVCFLQKSRSKKNPQKR